MNTLYILRWFIFAGLLLPAFTTGTPVSGQRETEADSTQVSLSAAGDWLHFGYDDAFSSCNTAETTINIANASQLERKWGVGCDDGSFSVMSRSPAVYNGKVYTSGAGQRLTAYVARIGSGLWQFGSGNLGWAPQPIVSENGIVFYMEGTSGIYELYAVNAETGQKIWQAAVSFNNGFNDTAQVRLIA